MQVPERVRVTVVGQQGGAPGTSQLRLAADEVEVADQDLLDDTRGGKPLVWLSSSEALGRQPLDLADKARHEQVVLATDRHHRADTHPRGCGDGPHTGGLVAQLTEQPGRGVEHSGPGPFPRDVPLDWMNMFSEHVQ